ncbi:MAG: hypothetical protein R3A44_05760 [Caldilineaceae bacterium]
MEITEVTRDMLNETRGNLNGYNRRHFMVQVVETMLDGSPMRAEKELGWNRVTLAKAFDELRGGFCLIEQFQQRGRNSAEEELPTLLDDIRELAERHSQTDPTFRTTRQYTRLTAVVLRQQLIDEKGHTDEALPTTQTIRTKLNELVVYPFNF